MFLKRLELQGFKSFPAKNTLEFPFGVIAVVGPNGSGKSNIADALRWVMGEQSMNRLRSKKGEDLIFNGTETKPRMGKCEVTLAFDNSDHAFPFEFKEVSIGRKIYRDGTNQYFINNSEVRLKDVAELIAKAKLGLKGYTIINQGMGDLILNSSPLERREIFEEALGLKEFQLKKKEALDKLSQTSVNLSTAQKLMEEIEPHLKFLKKQVVKLERREEIESKLRDLESQYFNFQWQALQTQLAGLRNSQTELDQKIKSGQKDFDALDRQINQEEKEAGSFFETFRNEEEEINKLDQERSQLFKELGKLEALIETGVKGKKSDFVPQSRFIEFLGELEAKLRDIAESENDLAKVKESVFDLVEKIRKILDQAGPKQEANQDDPLVSDKNKVLERMKSIDEKIFGLKSKIAEISRQNQEKRKQFSNLHQQLRQKEHELSSLQSQKDQIELKMQDQVRRQGELKEFFGSSFEGMEKQFSSSAKIVEIDMNWVRHEIEKLRVRLEMASEVDPETQKEYEATNARYEFLSTQISDLRRSMENLSGVAKELEQKIDEIFSSAFGRINDSFNHYFKLLFKGGKASLSVIKEIKAKPAEEGMEAELVDNSQAGGIEIKADLPGKKIKGLASLSGGERALTSIALLFSLISTSPPPFMVLDEIDAPLDESNSLRFINILQELKKNTQFVIVTHNREVMKEADVLYGVTMEEEGVSKLLSLQLQTAEEYSR